MPPFSIEDYYKLLQKIAVLETKIHRLEVNLEVNGSCGNDTTLPLNQNNGQKHANTRLTSTSKTTKKQEGCGMGDKSTSGSPPWNSLGAKPQSKSFSGEMSNLTTPDGLLRICSAYPSGNFPLENFWEGAKILVS